MGYKFILNVNLITESFEPKNCTLNELALAEIIRILGFSNIFSLKDISFSFDNYSISNLVLFLVNNNEFLKLRLLSEMIEYQYLINPAKFKSNNKESNFFVIYMERLAVNRSDYLFNFLYTLNKIFAAPPRMSAQAAGRNRLSANSSRNSGTSATTTLPVSNAPWCSLGPGG